MSSDKENEYLSDGITEEIINGQSPIGGSNMTTRKNSRRAVPKLVEHAWHGFRTPSSVPSVVETGGTINPP